jgi:hypothetical protein
MRSARSGMVSMEGGEGGRMQRRSRIVTAVQVL